MGNPLSRIKERLFCILTAIQTKLALIIYLGTSTSLFPYPGPYKTHFDIKILRSLNLHSRAMLN